MKKTVGDFTDFVDMLIRFLGALPRFMLNLTFWLLILWAVYKVGKFAYRRIEGSITLPLPPGKV